jgi:hypothetical protein
LISSGAIPKAHQNRLAQLGLIRRALGRLMSTPAGTHHSLLDRPLTRCRFGEQ